MIYAIQAGEGGPIKFGVAGNVDERLAALQTGNHLELRIIAYARLHQENERLIHYYLRTDRLRGEWFRPSEKALRVVDALRREASNEGVGGLHCVSTLIYEDDFDSIVWFRRFLGGPPLLPEDENVCLWPGSGAAKRQAV